MLCRRVRGCSVWATLAFAGVLLAGCVLPPDDPPRVQAIAVGSLGLGAVASPQAGEGWWRVYGDPQLDRLMAAALAGNPTLDQALARLRLARAGSAGSRAGLFPRVDLDAAETRQRFSAVDVYPPPYAGELGWRGSITGDLNWTLDLWGRQAALIAKAEADARASALGLAAARVALAGATVQAYLALARAWDAGDLALQTEQRRQHILEITGERVASGLDTDVERRRADGAVAEARVAREAVEADKARAVHQLAALAGLGAGGYGGIGRPALKPGAALMLPAALPTDLLARRPDVQAALAAITAATAGREAAEASFYPDIDLTGFAGFSSIGLANLLRASAGSVGAGPAIHLPLFDAGTLAARYRGATADLDAAVAGYNDAVLGAVLEVADQLSDLAALGKEQDHQARRLEDADAAFKLAEARYWGGLTGYVSVLDAETELLAARRQSIDLATAGEVARVKLLTAVGGSFDPAAKEPSP